MSIAKTIHAQIVTMDFFAFGAWGAKDLVALDEGLQFRTSGMVKNKGIVKVVLNGSDLYDITFGKVRKMQYSERVKIKDVFVEDLIKEIDNLVG